MFFRSVQLFNFIWRNFYYHAMQQYRYSNFSDVFRSNCIFVIDAAVKQLVSRSFLKYSGSAVTMAAHKIFVKKSNLHNRPTRFINSLWYQRLVASGGARPRNLAPGQHSSEESSQRRLAVDYTVFDLTCLGIEPKTFRIGSDIFNTAL